MAMEVIKKRGRPKKVEPKKRGRPKGATTKVVKMSDGGKGKEK